MPVTIVGYVKDGWSKAKDFCQIISVVISHIWLNARSLKKKMFGTTIIASFFFFFLANISVFDNCDFESNKFKTNHVFRKRSKSVQTNEISRQYKRVKIKASFFQRGSNARCIWAQCYWKKMEPRENHGHNKTALFVYLSVLSGNTPLIVDISSNWHRDTRIGNVVLVVLVIQAQQQTYSFNEKRRYFFWYVA